MLYYIIRIMSVLLLIFAMQACHNSSGKDNAVQLITDDHQQDSIFNKLVALTDNVLTQESLDDSLAFLILPVHASCPYCRRKTIDSIVSHRNDLRAGRYIIIAGGTRKIIASYFREQERELPVIENKLFLDTNNLSYFSHLYQEKPTIYYTYKRKAYQKVASLPKTIKEDLHQFFSVIGQNNLVSKR